LDIECNSLILKISDNMDSKNVSLEDLIKKDKQNRKGMAGGRGPRFGGNKFGGRGGAHGGQGSNKPVGNQVPRFRERAGIFKKRPLDEIVLPPRSGQAGQAGVEGPRMKRVSEGVNPPVLWL
jgi:hypothetical protein